jgi:hypothetical protein
MNIQDIIKNIKEQIADIHSSNMDAVSWGYENRVIISGNEAKYIINFIEKKIKTKQYE